MEVEILKDKKEKKKKDKKKALGEGEHNWKTTTFHSPTNCQQCDSLLWGIIKQGVVCSECKFISHEKCIGDVPPCGTAVAKSKRKSKEVGEKDLVVPNEGSSRQPGEHLWKVTTFHSPTNCQFCESLLWGLVRQGVVCSDCSYISHEKCAPQVLNCCTYPGDKKVFGLKQSGLEDSTPSLAAATPSSKADKGKEVPSSPPSTPLTPATPKKGEAVWKADPTSSEGREHEWSLETFKKPTYCSICTNFIWGIARQGYRCKICGITSHAGCRSSAGAECRPLEGLGSHHFVRGNLRLGSKCAVCQTKFHQTTGACDGYRCSVCGMKAHSKCLEKADPYSAIFVCNPRHSELICKKPPSTPDLHASLLEFLDSGDESGVPSLQNTPLIVFINPRSGGGQGNKVYLKLRKLLTPGQVFDLTQGGPKPGLLEYQKVDGLRILCCGGDGTCCWVLSVLDDMGWPAPYPPIAVLPLGTGNDLSRALGWGPGYRDEPLSPFLNLLTKDTTRSLDLDRWKVWYVPASVAGGGGPKGPQELNDEMKASEETSHITMNNYWSIGVDAKVALDFHRKREDNPQFFKSRTVNKGWYGVYGMKEMVGHPPVRNNIRLYLDGKEIVLSENLEGIIVLNIQSYGGGCEMWGNVRPDSGFTKPSMSDGLLEVVGVKGTFHMAKIRTGAKAKKLGQASSICIRFNTLMATQVDGEPKEQEAGTVFIVKHQSGTMLANMKKRLRDSGPQSPNSQLREMDDPQGGGSMVGFGEGGEVLSLSPTLGEVRTNMVAFINSRSGGGQGTKVYHKLRKLLSPTQVFDLSEGGPKPGLLEHRDMEGLQILCCGGDGTCCWVLSVLDDMGWPAPYPPIAVLPLGTGNDLSRALGWGPGYRDEALGPILKQVGRSVSLQLDRWKVWYVPGTVSPVIFREDGEGDVGDKENEEKENEGKGKEKEEEKDGELDLEEEDARPPRRGSGLAPELTEQLREHEETTHMTMNNYWSIGVDAKVALDFHQKREDNPAFFKSRTINKGWYGIYGMKEMYGHDPVRRVLRLFLDGEEVVLSDGLEGVIILNIPSYAGGCDLWGKTRQDSGYQKPSMSDGLLEVVGIRGTFHMAKIQTGTVKAKKLGQARSVVVQFTTNMSTQIDGEPKEQSTGTVFIQQYQSGTLLANMKRSMLKKTLSGGAIERSNINRGEGASGGAESDDDRGHLIRRPLSPQFPFFGSAKNTVSSPPASSSSSSAHHSFSPGTLRSPFSKPRSSSSSSPSLPTLTGSNNSSAPSLSSNSPTRPARDPSSPSPASPTSSPPLLPSPGRRSSTGATSGKVLFSPDTKKK